MENKKGVIGVVVAALVIIIVIFLLIKGCGAKEYKVTFDSNGGSAVNSQTVKEGDVVTKPTDPTRENYSFGGWYLDDKAYDFSTKVTKDITLKAHWNATNIVLTSTSMTIKVGETGKIEIADLPEGLEEDNLVWTSSDEKIATVDEDGNVKGLKTGSVIITVKSSDRKYETTLTLTVTDEDVTTSTTDTTKKTTTKKKKTTLSADQKALNKCIDQMTGKKIEKAGTSIEYKLDKCTVTLTKSTPKDAKNVVTKGVVTKVYRGTSDSVIEATYHVVSGKASKDVTVKHTVVKSPYTYTSVNAGGIKVLTVSPSAKNFYFTEAGGLEYVDGVGVQYPMHKKGTTYNMLFNNDENTTYAVKSAE